MGTKNDITWFGKILKRNPKIEVTEFSDLYPNKGTVYAQQTDELLKSGARLTAEKDAIIAAISGGTKQKEALEDILHYTSGASMMTKFDEVLFTRFVDRVIVYSRTEIGFDMKCGPIFRERI